MMRRWLIALAVFIAFSLPGFALSPAQKFLLFDGRITPVAVFNALSSSTEPSWLSTARAGGAMQWDSTGKLTWAPNNLVLNSATLSTQSVTVLVGQNYIVAFKGTGSITLSGAATGTINGTGVGDQVYQKITATTTSLTLTIAGSVTNGRLSAVTYETAPRSQDDVETTAAAFYGPRLPDYNPTTLAARGLLLEESRINSGFPNNPTGGSWRSGTMTNTTDSTLAPDGVTLARKLIDTAGGSTYRYNILNAISTVTSGAKQSAAQYWKAGSRSYAFIGISSWNSNAKYGTAIFDLSGTSDVGSIQQLTAGGAIIDSAKAYYVGNGWFRLEIVVEGITDTQVNFTAGLAGASNTAFSYGYPVYSGTIGDYAYQSFLNFELNDAFSTSDIPTTTVAVTRAADSISAASYTTNPAIIEYETLANPGTILRKKLAQLSDISSEQNEWIRYVSVYPIGTPDAYLDAHLTPGGSW